MSKAIAMHNSQNKQTWRLSSVDVLDQIVEVTSSKLWLALCAIVLIVIAAVVWGLLGKVPTSVMTRGMIVERGGVLLLKSHGSGIISKLAVKVGERVSPSQVVAFIDQPVLLDKIRAMKDGLTRTQADQKRSLAVRSTASAELAESVNRQVDLIQKGLRDLEEEKASAEERIRMEDELLADGLTSKLQIMVAKEHLIEIQQQISDRNAKLRQLDADKAQYQMALLTSDPEFKSRIIDQESSIRESENELRAAEEVISPSRGEVVELKVSEGSAVSAESPVLTIQANTGRLELVTYVPALDAKSIKPGMAVQISPSTTKREEYGYIKGRVDYVFPHPATPAALLREFQNEALTSALTSEGPVTEVDVSMETTNTTISGLAWSSSAGPPIRITSGTICTADVITRTRSPLTVAFPFLERHKYLQ